jgi:hypothetical protein
MMLPEKSLPPVACCFSAIAQPERLIQLLGECYTKTSNPVNQPQPKRQATELRETSPLNCR